MVLRNGKPVAVIVGVHDEDEVERLLMAYSPRLQDILEASRKQIREGDVFSHEEFWKEVAASRIPKGRRRKAKSPANKSKHDSTHVRRLSDRCLPSASKRVPDHSESP